MSSVPLTGIRVLDLGSMVAAPLGATLLGDMGADVIKIEPPGGEEGRRIGPRRGDEALRVGALLALQVTDTPLTVIALSTPARRPLSNTPCADRPTPPASTARMSCELPTTVASALPS